MDFISKVRHFVGTHRLFHRGDTIIVGVSGGPDSVALIHILNRLRFEMGLQLHMAHFNHHLRPSAGTDQKFVEQLARRLNVPLTVGHWPRPQSIRKGSLEERAREKRFDFLRRLALKINAQSIALAHTQNDLAETVLMRILRGAGLQGLRAILPARTIEGVEIIRPLLTVTRGDIENYLKKNKLSFRTDPTNRQTQYFRNKIRLKLLPLLEKEYNKNIRSVLANVSEIVTADYDFLEEEASRYFSRTAHYSPRRKTIKFPTTAFLKLHPAMKRMLLRMSIERLKGDTKRLTAYHFSEIEELLDCRPVQSVVHLPQELRIRKEKGCITVSA